MKHRARHIRGSIPEDMQDRVDKFVKTMPGIDLRTLDGISYKLVRGDIGVDEYIQARFLVEFNTQCEDAELSRSFVWEVVGDLVIEQAKTKVEEWVKSVRSTLGII